MTPDQIVSAVRAHLDRIDELAKDASVGPWQLGIVYGSVISAGLGPVARNCAYQEDAEFIAACDPSSLLSRVAADRKLLDFIEYMYGFGGSGGEMVKILAQGLGIDTEEKT